MSPQFTRPVVALLLLATSIATAGAALPPLRESIRELTDVLNNPQVTRKIEAKFGALGTIDGIVCDPSECNTTASQIVLNYNNPTAGLLYVQVIGGDALNGLAPRRIGVHAELRPDGIPLRPGHGG